MHQARGGRKGQRFSMTHASRETRFAAVKAALRVSGIPEWLGRVVNATISDFRHGRSCFVQSLKNLHGAVVCLQVFLRPARQKYTSPSSKLDVRFHFLHLFRTPLCAVGVVKCTSRFSGWVAEPHSVCCCCSREARFLPWCDCLCTALLDSSCFERDQQLSLLSSSATHHPVGSLRGGKACSVAHWLYFL